MLRTTTILLLLSTPALGEILDLRHPQTEGFRSIVDLRGLAGIAAHEAVPPKPEPVKSADVPASLRMKLPDVAYMASADAAETRSETANQKPVRTVYVGYTSQNDEKAKAPPRATRSSFRLGRRR
jgi:hypothetical protein